MLADRCYRRQPINTWQAKTLKNVTFGMSDLRRKQVALSQFIIQLHSLFKQRVFLLAQVGNLLANLLWILSAAAPQKPIPFTQLMLKRLNATCKQHQVFTQGLKKTEHKH